VQLRRVLRGAQLRARPLAGPHRLPLLAGRQCRGPEHRARGRGDDTYLTQPGGAAGVPAWFAIRSTVSAIVPSVTGRVSTSAQSTVRTAASWASTAPATPMSAHPRWA